MQWLATEKARASILPETFWYFSMAGGAMLLAYAISRLDPVFILGQAAGLVIYARNIYFIWLGKREPSPGRDRVTADLSSRAGVKIQWAGREK